LSAGCEMEKPTPLACRAMDESYMAPQHQIVMIH
jgi:hypothetical protein